MADADFFDALILGSLLLGGAFFSVYVGFFLVPAFWIVLLCGWPLIIATIAAYELLRRFARTEVMRGSDSPFRLPATTKYCPACGVLMSAYASACPVCGFKLLPTYDVTTAPPRFCQECGSVLEHGSRYRRAWCPKCQVYR